ncbi:MAG: hypothetical protein H6506_02380 [Calditrichaeota bacterium]|nr:hypothetical protein [Calditrichota bacterium]
MVLFTGCDLFSTRSPEPPDGARGSWEVPLTPTDVLTNISVALFERNASNYLRSFQADSFMFEADPQVLLQQPSIADWDYAREQSHINSLLSEGVLPRDSIIFVVFSATDQTLLGDTAQVTTRYDLTAQVALSGAPGPLAGEAVFSMRVGSQGYWEIVRWSDRRTEELASWSDLKALVQPH